MMPPTKDQLEQENAELRDRITELEAGRPTTPAAPQRPEYGLSAGEKDDLLSNGVTTSPFNGEQLNALDELTAEEVAGLTPRAKRNAERAQQAKAARAATDGEPGAEVAPDVE
jgi:hypothetical protein